MKTAGLIAIVVAVHCTAIGAMCFIQGCGTTKTQAPPPEIPAMPPAVVQPETPVVKPPVKAPETRAGKELKPGGTVEYEVQTGDSLSKIAAKFGTRVSVIREANKLQNDKIRIGQKLIVPAATGAAAAAKPAAPAKAAKTEAVKLASNEYLVQAGDNLSKLAAKFGVKVSALREANKLQSDKLKIGQKLTIPDAKKGVEAAKSETPAVTPTPATPPSTPAANTAFPVVAPKSATVEPVPPADAPVSSTVITHTVRPNDDLNSIAKMYAVTVDEIAELNQLTNRIVQVGQVLKIP